MASPTGNTRICVVGVEIGKGGTARFRVDTDAVHTSASIDQLTKRIEAADALSEAAHRALDYVRFMTEHGSTKYEDEVIESLVSALRQAGIDEPELD